MGHWAWTATWNGPFLNGRSDSVGLNFLLGLLVNGNETLTDLIGFAFPRGKTKFLPENENKKTFNFHKNFQLFFFYFFLVDGFWLFVDCVLCWRFILPADEQSSPQVGSESERKPIENFLLCHLRCATYNRPQLTQHCGKKKNNFIKNSSSRASAKSCWNFN